MSIKVNVNLSARAEEAWRKAAATVTRELFVEFQVATDISAWKWPRKTVRKEGKSVVFSPRNINDRSDLRRTGYYEMTGPNTAKFTWSALYATGVHEGYVARRKDGSAGAILPARPWTSAVLGRVQAPGIRPYPLQERMKAVWLAYFRAGRR